MEEKEIFSTVIEGLDNLGIPYMVTGSLAVSFYGTPRATHDIDLVLAISPQDGNKIKLAFENEFYVSDIDSAIRYFQMFNLIHQGSQLKVDCWVLNKEDSYRKRAFERKQSVQLWGKNINLISKEDLVISKLLWHQDAQANIHLNDIRGIMNVQREMLDRVYISDWCNKLSVIKPWLELEKEVYK